MSKEKAKQEITLLVEKYKRLADSGKIKEFNEASKEEQLEIEFSKIFYGENYPPSYLNQPWDEEHLEMPSLGAMLKHPIEFLEEFHHYFRVLLLRELFPKEKKLFVYD